MSSNPLSDATELSDRFVQSTKTGWGVTSTRTYQRPQNGLSQDGFGNTITKYELCDSVHGYMDRHFDRRELKTNKNRHFRIPTITLIDGTTCDEVVLDHYAGENAAVTFLCRGNSLDKVHDLPANLEDIATSDRIKALQSFNETMQIPGTSIGTVYPMKFVTDSSATIGNLNPVVYDYEMWKEVYPNDIPCTLKINSDFIPNKSTGVMHVQYLASKQGFNMPNIEGSDAGEPFHWSSAYPHHLRGDPTQGFIRSNENGVCVATSEFEYAVEAQGVWTAADQT